jgi:protein-tyrosine phosphatase
MLDDAHLALMPPHAVRDELALLAAQDPRIPRLAHAKPGAPDPAAIVTLENDAGIVVFQMVAVPLPGVPGRLFVGQLPGRASKLAGELDALVAFGIRHVFCLIPRIDLAEPYRVPTYVEEASSRFGERLRMIDVVDYEVPPDDMVFEAALDAAERAVMAGESVYVHCGAGCGRAGVFASCMLVQRGTDALEAIGRFRAIRGCGPETLEQVAYVVRYAQRRSRGTAGLLDAGPD